jgi:hypothetical protein
MSRYIDRDTLAIARLVAEAEGVSLELAIAEQRELFGSDAEAEAEGVSLEEWLTDSTRENDALEAWQNAYQGLR